MGGAEKRCEGWAGNTFEEAWGENVEGWGTCRGEEGTGSHTEWPTTKLNHDSCLKLVLSFCTCDDSLRSLVRTSQHTNTRSRHSRILCLYAVSRWQVLLSTVLHVSPVVLVAGLVIVHVRRPQGEVVAEQLHDQRRILVRLFHVGARVHGVHVCLYCGGG